MRCYVSRVEPREVLLNKPGGEAGVPPAYRGSIDPEYRVPGRLPYPLDPDLLLSSGKCRILHSGRNRIGVISVSPPGKGEEELVIKEFRIRGVRRLKSRVEPSPAFKSWRGARILRERGLGTPAPVAWLEKRRGRRLEICYYISTMATGMREIRGLFGELSGDGRMEMLSALAEFVSGCHRGGVLHRDLSDGNVLVSRDFRDIRFMLVDTNRVRGKNRVGRIRGLRNINRLGIPPGLQSEFLKAYLGMKDIPWRFRAWYRMNKAGFSGWIRLKKALRLRRLAERLRIQ